MIGQEIMIAPVYTQNAKGRYVYLPEEMTLVKFTRDNHYTREKLAKGHHYIEVSLAEVPVFIRKGKTIPIVKVAECVEKLDTEHVEYQGCDN